MDPALKIIQEILNNRPELTVSKVMGNAFGRQARDLSALGRYDEFLMSLTTEELLSGLEQYKKRVWK